MADDDALTRSRSRSSSPRATSRRARRSARADNGEPPRCVAKLPKPTPAAWAANQVAREQPDLIAALLDAGAALRAAQDAALAGGGAETCATATQAERRAVDAVMRVARHAQARPASRSRARWPTACARRCTPPPATPSCARRCRPAGSWGRRRRAARGRSRSRRPIFPPPPPKKKPAAKKRPGDEDDAAAREAEERAERERLALEDELREARGTLKVRERVAKGAEEDAQDAAEALDAAQAALDQAAKAVEDASAEKESAQRVLKGARKERDQARDTVARLEERLD